MTRESVLELREISKTYRVGSGYREVLSGVSLQLYAGSITVLRGSSGSGKSSVIRVAGLLSYPDGGTVLISGEQVSRKRYPLVRRERIGIVFQNSNLLGELTVDENLALASRTSSRRHRKALLNEWELDYLSGVPAARTSGGEAQRIAFCRALMNDPQILLLDEPSGGLDACNTGILKQMICECRAANRAVLLASHDDAMLDLADEVIELEGGKRVGL